MTTGVVGATGRVGSEIVLDPIQHDYEVIRGIILEDERSSRVQYGPAAV